MPTYPTAQSPLVLRYGRLMDAFAKSDDERDFYLDKVEGFIFYVDLSKEEELKALEKELEENRERYCLIPKMTFYETKKFMEGFVNEKVYDIDTKEKLLDIIQSKEARENFLEFLYDHLPELEKWQQYYHERSRIRIIEWLRSQEVQFVFEEELDLPKVVVEKLKRHLFEARAPKEIASARELAITKARTYYSNEALNPRPKRGRPPKQVVKVETEPQLTADIYLQVPSAVRPFLYLPDITSPASVSFSGRFETDAQMLASLRGTTRAKIDAKLQALSDRLESLRHLSTRVVDIHDVPGIVREEKVIRAVAQEAQGLDAVMRGGAAPPERIRDVVKEALPTKERGLLPPKKGEEGKKKEIKMVTQLKKGKRP